MKIISYQDIYEKSWIYTKALAYIFSEFWDDRETEKTHFTTDPYEDSIELIAVEGDKVIGLLDLGIYNQKASEHYFYYPCRKLAYFANFAVHPDHQGQGIAQALFEKAEELLRLKKVSALSIYTRGDAVANHLYQKWAGEPICETYLVEGRLLSDKKVKLGFDAKQRKLSYQTLTGESLPYTFYGGHYSVANSEDLDLFDCDSITKERTYLKLL
ncbi:MAG: GNAT family N-acetyltransferase [Streptococcus sp.]|nr:GNAT family N-acetyltransferase [Streptococcus sp.]